MKTKLRNLGTSRGVVIPKPFLEQMGIGADEEVELVLTGDRLTITRPRRVREGWADGSPIELTDEDVSWINGMEDLVLSEEWSW